MYNIATQNKKRIQKVINYLKWHVTGAGLVPKVVCGLQVLLNSSAGYFHTALGKAIRNGSWWFWRFRALSKPDLRPPIQTTYAYWKPAGSILLQKCLHDPKNIVPDIHDQENFQDHLFLITLLAFLGTSRYFPDVFIGRKCLSLIKQ